MTNGQSAHFILVDEHLLPRFLHRPETNLQTCNIDTVRTIVAKHLSDNEPLPKPHWMRRWFTNPEPQDKPVDWRLEPPSGALNPMDYYGEVETPYADSLMDRFTEAHLNEITEARKESAREAVLVTALHLETHLENLDNETMIDTVVRSATQDCIDVVRGILKKLDEAPSGGA